MLVARLNHVVAIVLLAAPSVGTSPHGATQPGPWYVAAVAFLGALLVYEHTLIRPGDLRRLNRAFFTVNASGSVVFAVLAIVDVLT
jgi:4-hydroxybenzoate polyprenyltransferase